MRNIIQFPHSFEKSVDYTLHIFLFNDLQGLHKIWYLKFRPPKKALKRVCNFCVVVNFSQQLLAASCISTVYILLLHITYYYRLLYIITTYYSLLYITLFILTSSYIVYISIHYINYYYIYVLYVYHYIMYILLYCIVLYIICYVI